MTTKKNIKTRSLLFFTLTIPWNITYFTIDLLFKINKNYATASTATLCPSRLFLFELMDHVKSWVYI